MYYIHNYIEDTWRSAETWWDLIAFFYRDDSYHYYNDRENTRSVAHSINDKQFIYAKWDEDLKRLINPVYEPRPNIIYDEDMIIVNLHEIRKALKVFKPRVVKWRGYRKRYYDTHPFQFRVDPVPSVGSGRGGGSSYRKPKRNKNYFAKLQEFAEGDSRARKGIFDTSLWWDDFPYRGTVRSWKNKKKRKQWM